MKIISLCAFTAFCASLITVNNDIPAEPVFLRILEVLCLIATLIVAFCSLRDTRKVMEDQRTMSICIFTINQIYKMQEQKINTAVGDSIKHDKQTKNVVQAAEFFESRPDMVAALFSIKSFLKHLSDCEYVDKKNYRQLLANSIERRYFSYLRKMDCFLDDCDDFFKEFDGVRIKDKNEVNDENDNSKMDISINSDNNFGNIAVVNNGNMDVVNNQK